MKKVLPRICMVASLVAIGALSACNDKECSHHEVTILGTEATCTEKGMTDGIKCDICQEILVAQQEIAALGHTKEEVSAKAATCTEDGNVAYTHCSTCGKNFDLEGNVLDKVVIDALGHTKEEVSAKEATCTEDGNVAYTHCSVCDKNFDLEGNVLDKVVIDALGHTEEEVLAKAATCTEDGNIAYTHCSTCGKNFDSEGNVLENVSIEALGHKFIDGKCFCGETYVAPLGEWALTTEIKSGDKVLIGAPAYNKLLSVEKVSAGSFYNKGVDYSSTDYSLVTDSEIFVVTANSDNTYTFTSLTGKVIALAESYSSLNEDGINKSWALVERREGVYYLNNTGRNMYLEWYDSMGNWSAYKTINSGSEGLFEISFYKQTASVGADHVHNYISDVHETTCTEDGYTTFTCECGDNYKEDGLKAIGHQYTPKVTEATCTEDGYTTFTCSCGDSYVEKGETAPGHKYVDGKCSCGEEDPSIHKHNYKAEVKEATCTEEGYTTYVCECGDSYIDENSKTPKVSHVDENKDIFCDYNCGKKVIPATGSTLSLTHAINLVKSNVSLYDYKYYLEGTIIEVKDTTNGGIIISDDEATFYIRITKNEDGTIGYKSLEEKFIVGDKIRIYGTIGKSTTAPYDPQMGEGWASFLTQHEHEYGDATCTTKATCRCGATTGEALGHKDENADKICDVCKFDLELTVEYLTIKTSEGMTAETTKLSWSFDNFDVVINKNTATNSLYTTATDHARMYKNNSLEIINKTDKKISKIVIESTSTSYVDEIEAMFNGEQYIVTTDGAFVTIEFVEPADSINVVNTKGSTRIKTIEVSYK